MSSWRLSDQLLSVARARLDDVHLRCEGNLRRAASDLYFAAFHSVCEALVQPLNSADEQVVTQDAYRVVYSQIYRQVRHDNLEKQCRQIAQSNDFTEELRRFAKHLVTLKNKRESADYDPLHRLVISVVRTDLELTETRLERFWKSEPGLRAAFVCQIGLRVSK